MTIIAFAAGLLAIVVSTYGAIITARVNAWSKAKLAEHGLTEAAKWQADLKAGLLTGAICCDEGLAVGVAATEVPIAATRGVIRSVATLFVTSLLISIMAFV